MGLSFAEEPLTASDNFAELLVGFEISMGIYDIVKCECLRDHGFVIGADLRHLSHHLSTRIARSVTHREGLPGSSSISNHTRPFGRQSSVQ
jgi:hypothetical protein